MKAKVLCLALALVLAYGTAYAEIDLSGMSLEELIELRDRVQAAMWASDEYQSVTVPQGIWVAGEDIPVGKWIVSCAPGTGYLLKECDITWGGKPSTGGRISILDRKGSITLYDPTNSNYKEGQLTEFVLELAKGDYVVIDTGYNKAIFSTYTGKPSLGFK